MALGDGMGQHGAWTQMTCIQCLAVPHPNLMILEKRKEKQRPKKLSGTQQPGTGP